MKTRILTSFIAALCTLGLPTRLCAQEVVFTARNGANTAYCGLVGSGPGIVHRFSNPEPTHDIASVSEPGNTNWAASSATSRLDVTPSATGITIRASGNVMRGPLLGFGVFSTADARDNWTFTLTQPARFIWSASFSGTSTDSIDPAQGFSFVGLRAGSVIPDPGTPPEAFGGGVSGPGTVVKRASGRMLPGPYEISFNCRVEGNNINPYSGSFETSLALELGPDVPKITQAQILPSGLKLEWTDLAPKQFTVETTSSLSAGNWTPVHGLAWPISARTIELPAPSTFPAFYRVKAE